MAENSYSVNSREKEQNDTAEQQNQQQQPQPNSRPSSVNKDREDRLRQVRDRQNEERLRKLNDIKQQALQAQKVREQKELERRKRIEEMRLRDQDRRAQVEERKRQIEDVDRDRREYIIRKNQEREARLESKRKNDRCSSVFAFGSSTPRMLEPSDTGGSSFWTSRRATSTTNVMFAGLPLSRRSSERDVDGSKKRATSAGGLDRDPPEDFRMSTSMYEVFHWDSPSPSSGIKPAKDEGDANNVQTSVVYNNRVARRRTDLMPTIPSPRDATIQTKPFTRSPGRAYSMTRLDQLAQPRRRVPTPELNVVVEHRPVSMTRSYPSKKPGVDTNNQLSRSMSHLAAAASKQLRKSDTSTSMSHLNFSRPLVTPRMNKTERMRRQRLLNMSTVDTVSTTGVRSGEATPSRPGSAMSGTSSVASGVTMRRPTSAAHTPSRRPRPASIAGTGLSSDYTKKNSTSNNDIKNAGSEHSKPPIPHPRTKSQSGKGERTPSKSALGLKGSSSARSSAKTTPLQSPSSENVGIIGSHINDQKSLPNTPKRKVSRQEAAAAATPSPATPTVNGEHKTPKKTLVETKPDNKNVEQLNNQVSADAQTTNLVEAESVDNKISAVTIKSIEKKPEIKETEPVTVVETEQPPMETSIISDSSDKITNENIMSASMPAQLDHGESTEATDSMSASMIAKIRITTEEEAKAALAERRRIAREEAERQAELERQRLEEEARVQAERERAEEEEQRRLEEETLRLAQQQREAEEKRLREAIEEAQRKEAEERQRKLEEERQKAEKEEAERKAREEAERQRLELAAKLEKEEKEREARRKRVEAIMLRTRGRGSSAGTNNSGGAIQSNNDMDNTRDESDGSVSGRSAACEENMVVRNGTDTNKQLNNKNDNNTNNVLREVQIQSADSTPIINTRQRTVNDEFNSVLEQQTATSKVPLNGSNVVHLFEQHISSNANTEHVDVLINEDTINSNKSITESPSQQQSPAVVTTDLA